MSRNIWPIWKLTILRWKSQFITIPLLRAAPPSTDRIVSWGKVPRSIFGKWSRTGLHFLSKVTGVWESFLISEEQALFLVFQDLDYTGNSESAVTLSFLLLKSLDSQRGMRRSCANVLSYWEMHVLNKQVETCLPTFRVETANIQLDLAFSQLCNHIHNSLLLFLFSCQYVPKAAFNSISLFGVYHFFSLQTSHVLLQLSTISAQVPARRCQARRKGVSPWCRHRKNIDSWKETLHSP